MSDWLMDDSADGGYLGMDDPAMPDAAPAPPSAPTAVATPPGGDDWLGGDAGGSANDDWLGGSATQEAAPAPAGGHDDWMSGAANDQAVSPGMPPEPAPIQQYAQPHSAPIAASPQGDISVMSPQ